MNAKSDALYQLGAIDGNRSDDYVRTTVYLATVLFLVGINGHFALRGARIGLITVAMIIVAFAAIELITLPKPALSNGPIGLAGCALSPGVDPPWRMDSTPVRCLELQPVVRAHARPVGRVGPLGDHAFKSERGARLHHVVDRLVERPDRRPRRPGDGEAFEELAPPRVREQEGRPVVEPQHVEGDEREAPGMGEVVTAAGQARRDPVEVPGAAGAGHQLAVEHAWPANVLRQPGQLGDLVIERPRRVRTSTLPSST